MPRLDSFTLRIKTGNDAPADTPQYVINGFLVDFDETNGAASSGQVFEATGEPGSFPHTLLLCGPKQGAWDIEELTATYRCQGSEPYTIRFGAVRLDEASDLDIWHDRPEPVFDV